MVSTHASFALDDCLVNLLTNMLKFLWFPTQLLNTYPFFLAGPPGTPYWMAPELLLQKTGNTAASDVYAFGIILYEVFSRKDPYEVSIKGP